MTACNSCGEKEDRGHVLYFIKNYDPTSAFTNYPKGTIWINHETKNAWILTSKENGEAYWKPLTEGGVATLLSILTQCGKAEPNTSGELDFSGECGLNILADPCEDFYIDILTGKGLTGGGRVRNQGSVTLEFDSKTAGDVTGPDSSTIGNVAVFTDETGKTLGTSNLTVNDGSLSIVKSTSGEQVLRVSNTTAQNTASSKLEIKTAGEGATPYAQFISSKQTWSAGIDPADGSFKGALGSSITTNPVFTFLPNGVMRLPYQPTAAAYLLKTPVFATNEEVFLGSNLAFVKLFDTDGFNQSANNFFVGDGSTQGAYYESQYDNARYLVAFQFLMDSGKANSEYTLYLHYGAKSLPCRFGNPPSSGNRTISEATVLPLNKGERFRFALISTYPALCINIKQDPPIYDNYVSIYMLG